MAGFYDYVRGRTDEVPEGYSEPGLRAYRHLVLLGATQMVEAHHPELRAQLGEEAWQALMRAFVQDSAWDSPFYGDVYEEFVAFLARTSA